MFRLSRRFARSAGVIAVLAISLEVLARYWLGLGDPTLYVAHPTIEYLLKPGQVARPYGNMVEVNRFGMRSPDFAPDKAAGEYRVLVFGDSVVNGGNRIDQADLATSLLRRRLHADREGSVTLGNVAAGSDRLPANGCFTGLAGRDYSAPRTGELERPRNSTELGRIERLLDQLGIPFVWGSTCLGRAEAAGLSPFGDDIHLTAAGQAALAECLLDALSLPANPGRRVVH